MDKEKDLIIQILGDEEISELDFETREALPGWEDEDGETVFCNREIKLDKDGNPFKGYQTSEGEWVSIECIENLLTSFKEKGATHVSMEHHCDHIGYMFDYGILRVATPKDSLEADLQAEKVDQSRNATRIAELEKELKELKSQ